MGRVLQPVATPRSGRRGPRKRFAEEPQGDGILWPSYSEQLQLRAHIPEAEQAAAAERAHVLVTLGWGALEEWLNHPGQHPGERPAAPLDREPSERRKPSLADLFDAA